jgi:hypothetical protein
MKKLDLAYFGGLFDGEGYFTIRFPPFKDGTKTRINRCVVVEAGILMTDPGPIFQLYKQFGGSWTKRDIRKGTNFIQYEWKVRSLKLDAFIKVLYPFLRIKKRQCEICMELRSVTENKKNGKHGKLTENEKIIQFDLAQKLKDQRKIKEIIGG